ncbi:MAG: DUF6240 domain-containing protein [bacterium]|nr:DUF6240 domain-containing protein [bacterium]MCM1374705.1 DUF6240 domain-containing protein [Muribaculum sp.]
MKISFEQPVQANHYQEQGVQGAQPQQRHRSADRYRGYGAHMDGRDSVHPGNALGSRWNAGRKASRGKTVAELQAQAGAADVQAMQNQMTVMSHTMSDEDYARMAREGYDPSQMDPRDTVTILDKIKAELVKAGQNIVGYTDTLDMETLTEAVGDQGLARALQESFAAADVPLSAENLEKTLQAMEMAEGLEEPNEGDYYYMIRSGLEATIKGYYLAEASGSALEQEPQAEYFDAEVKGYTTRNIEERREGASQSAKAAPDSQELDRLLASLGRRGTEQEREAASWLIQRGLEIDQDSLRRAMEIRSVSFPVSRERVAQAAASAIADGYEPLEGNLADTRSIRQKAYELVGYYQSSDAERLISDHRLLEEIRLRMTVETNIKLLESGYSIDTKPIEETIEALKQAQQELAREFFPDPELSDREAVERYQQLESACKVTEELPSLPIDTVGRLREGIPEGEAATLEAFHREGKALKTDYEKAGQRYEAIWTQPRADMGDSIRKAFANVDDILQDMGYEPTEENRRAVRVLGYNRMEITPEHVEEIKAACATVEEVTRRMTPAAVLRMIRDGVNPLEQSLPQLREYFEGEGQEQQARQEMERYSRFLYKLERKNEITPEEKSAFIGCYRLLRQLEKGDSAAIGSIVSTGAEMNFSTLLSAVRSRRVGHMNTLVDDAVGGLSRLESRGVRIDEQINLGYMREWNRVLEEAVEPDTQDYAEAQSDADRMRREWSQAATASPEIYGALERAEETPTVVNILAAQNMEAELQKLMSRFDSGSRREKPTQLWQRLGTPREFQESYQETVVEQEEQLEHQILEETEQLVDVRSLHLMSKQLHLMGSLAHSEEYYFPMELGGEIAAVHLQICRGEQEKGMVRIELTSAGMGSLKGEFQVRDHTVNGYFVGNQSDAVMNMRRSTDIFDSYLAEGLQLGQVEYVYHESGKTVMSWDRAGAADAAQQGSLYATAKAFLQTVRDVEKQMEGNPEH